MCICCLRQIVLLKLSTRMFVYNLKSSTYFYQQYQAYHLRILWLLSVCPYLSFLFRLFLARQKRTEYNNPVVCFFADAWIRWCVSLQENTTCFNFFNGNRFFVVQGSALCSGVHIAVRLKMSLKSFPFGFSPFFFRKINKKFFFISFLI